MKGQILSSQKQMDQLYKIKHDDSRGFSRAEDFKHGCQRLRDTSKIFYARNGSIWAVVTQIYY